MLLLISSQYASPIHPVLHPPAVVGFAEVIPEVVPWVVVPIVEVEFPPLGSMHEHTLQYWVFALGPQQSPPS